MGFPELITTIVCSAILTFAFTLILSITITIAIPPRLRIFPNILQRPNHLPRQDRRDPPLPGQGTQPGYLEQAPQPLLRLAALPRYIVKLPALPAGELRALPLPSPLLFNRRQRNRIPARPQPRQRDGLVLEAAEGEGAGDADDGERGEVGRERVPVDADEPAGRVVPERALGGVAPEREGGLVPGRVDHGVEVGARVQVRAVLEDDPARGRHVLLDHGLPRDARRRRVAVPPRGRPPGLVHGQAGRRDELGGHVVPRGRVADYDHFLRGVDERGAVVLAVDHATGEFLQVGVEAFDLGYLLYIGHQLSVCLPGKGP